MSEPIEFLPSPLLDSREIEYANSAIQALDFASFQPGRRIVVSGVQLEGELCGTSRANPSSLSAFSIEVGAEANSRMQLCLDVGIDVAATILSLPTIVAMRLSVVVPARLSRFLPVLAVRQRTPNSALKSGTLRKEFWGFVATAENSLPTVDEVLRRGAVAIVSHREAGGGSAFSEEEERLMHQLIRRWGQGSCSCC